MKLEEFISQQVSKIREGFGILQIREETWKYTLKDIGLKCRLDTVIFESMSLYAKIIEQAKCPLRNLK